MILISLSVSLQSCCFVTAFASFYFGGTGGMSADDSEAMRDEHATLLGEGFVAVHVVERKRYGRAKRAAIICSAAAAIAFMGAFIFSKPRSPSARSLALARQELAEAGADEEDWDGFETYYHDKGTASTPSVGVFTGHSTGKEGTPLTFGRGTYHNIFSTTQQYTLDCDPGMFGPGGYDCAECPADHFCEGGKAATKCPDNTVSQPRGSTVGDCKCAPGFVGSTPDECKPCPAGSYCPGDTAVHPCPEGSDSKEGQAACACNPGLVGADGQECVPCPAGFVCPGGDVKTACPMRSTSSVGAKVGECFCSAGFFEPTLSKEGENPECMPCPANKYCSGGPTAQACPANTVSDPGQTEIKGCTCAPGYRGSDYRSCRQCGIGNYCNGGNDVHACPEHSTSPPGASSAAQCKCDPGHVASTDGVGCRACTAGYYCLGGNKEEKCPGSTTSEPGSTFCACAKGTKPKEAPPPPQPPAFFVVDAGNFDQVRARCIEQGGDLASIHGPADVAQARTLCGGSRCYLGMVRDSSGAPFYWLDGTAMDYTAWDNGQPQPHETKTVTGPNGDQWHDWGTGHDVFKGLCKEFGRAISKPCYQIRECNECLSARDSRPEHTSVCVPVQKETNGNVCEPKIYIARTRSTLNLQEDTACVADVSASADAGMFVVGAGTYNQVRDKCRGRGGDLASIHSDADVAMARALCPGQRCYIGLVRDAAGTPFYWVDGSDLDFTAWDNGQPQPSETKTVTGPNGDQWHDWGTGGDVFKGLCRKFGRAHAKECYKIRDCHECMASYDSRPYYTSVCVPVKEDVNGNVCEPKVYIAKTKSSLNLQVDGECIEDVKSDCQRCAAGSFCIGDGTEKTCPAHSASDVGSEARSDCKCLPGYYAKDGACEWCEDGFFCPGGDQGKKTCGRAATSNRGARVQEECSCPAGMSNTLRAEEATEETGPLRCQPPPPPPCKDRCNCDASECSGCAVGTPVCERCPTGDCFSAGDIQFAEGASLVWSWCNTYRSRLATATVEQQMEYMARCQAADCVQSLTAKMGPGCRYTDADGFCYKEAAAQEWCADNKESLDCHDPFGANAAVEPLGSLPASRRLYTEWMPKKSVALVNARPGEASSFSCSCMKHCYCQANPRSGWICQCDKQYPTAPVGYNNDGWKTYKFEKGIKVVGRWKGNDYWYPATISKVNADGTLQLRFDDGDFEPKQPWEHVRLMRVVEAATEGVPCIARWKGGPHYPGKVVGVQRNGNLKIQFDDGDYEDQEPPGHVKMHNTADWPPQSAFNFVDAAPEEQARISVACSCSCGSALDV